jgi:hypothetical protein
MYVKDVMKAANLSILMLALVMFASSFPIFINLAITGAA